jgi:excisionase family DNA binding protein
MQHFDDDHFLTTDEMMAYLQVTQRTIYRLIERRKLPAVRVGRQWRCRKRDLDLWLQKLRAGIGPGAIEVDRPRILVVDDEVSVCELVARELSRYDFDVEMAHDGRSAVERVREGHYDLLITDLRMPGMDGLSVIREIRRATAELPILIITGYSTEASAIEALNLGVSGYLTKPFRLPRVTFFAARALGEPLPPDFDGAEPDGHDDETGGQPVPVH